MGSGGHLGFIQFTRVAQSCHIGNNAEFVLGPHELIIKKGHKKENF